MYAIVAIEHTEMKQNKKRFPKFFLKREKMITTESTTCYTISGPESFEQGKIVPGLICYVWEVKWLRS